MSTATVTRVAGPALPDDGLVLVLKRDCPTCRLVEPVVRELLAGSRLAALLCQDDPAFPAGLPVSDDRDLHASWMLGIDIVPTLVRRESGRESARAVGWHRGEWEAIAGLPGLGAGLPEQRPGCGSLSVEAGMAEELSARFGATGLHSREIEVAFPVDPVEQAFDLGWSDGLPVVPPTPVRVLRMLAGTRRGAGEVLGAVPPSGTPCTVEKLAVNAVMAGCRPAYMPVLLAALEAALDPAYAWQGLLATTMGAGNFIVVNGPEARRLGLNAGVNVLGQGNRANSTIGRALQLVGRNLGGSLPGGVDRSTQGHPGKLGVCFAEHEDDPDWQPLAQSRGVAAGVSAVTLYAGVGSGLFFDEHSQAPEPLCDSFVRHIAPFAGGRDGKSRRGVMALVSPEHRAVFRRAGWHRQRIHDTLTQALDIAGEDLLLVSAGGGAGLMSTIVHGWGAGPDGSQPVTREVCT